MSVREAAALVLKEAGSPLHAREIAKRILAKKLWKTAGRTPHQTVAARLYMDIKRNAGSSPFVLTAPQTFSLRSSHAAPARQDDGQEREGGSTPNPAVETFSFTDSAEKVLERFGNKQPMHYRAITKKALEHGWLETEGRTPEASMYAQILTEIRRYQKRGEQPRFVQHGKGYVGLSRWMGQGLAFEIEQHNKKVRQALLKRLLEMKWEEFEELIARLLAEVGFDEIEMTGRSGDGGIDVRATLVVGEVIRTRMAVQVKKWKRNVQAPVVQQVRGSLGTHEQGLIITTSDFSAGARQEAARADAVPLALMNGAQLVVLLVENGIGITRRSHHLIELSSDVKDSTG
ncbi:MAG TPA: HTH domain-containing protein [Gemmatimonadales bacterium]|nr:HTH domain-containing protein [Gemmatimonadales bacterium]